jgi:hypothetical protein
MHCDKMAVTDMSFRYTCCHCERLRGVFGQSQQSYGNCLLGQWGMQIGRLFGKRRNDQCSSLRWDAQQTSSCASWRRSEEENCHPSTWQREASHCTSDLADSSKERLGTALPCTLQSGFGPPQTITCSGPWKITRELTTTGLTRQFRKPCEAGCEEL